MTEMGGFRTLHYLVARAAMSTSQSTSRGWIIGKTSEEISHRVYRAGVRVNHLSNTVVGGSSLVVDSLHTRPYRDHDRSTKRFLHHQEQHDQGEHPLSAQSKMAQEPKFAYTVIYVPDVQQAVDFYQKAFGVKCRRMDHSKRWGEMESGATTIAFTPVEQRETELTGGVYTPDASQPRHNVELSFSYSDVDAAFKHAVEAGAVPVSPPEEKEWGQKVGYVRDINGVMIRMGSYVHEQS